jgi:hypothetical protein
MVYAVEDQIGAREVGSLLESGYPQRLRNKRRHD